MKGKANYPQLEIVIGFLQVEIMYLQVVVDLLVLVVMIL
jgi:hypothetical protein